jgi:transcriptional regulator with XRE-family HTH domain
MAPASTEDEHSERPAEKVGHAVEQVGHVVEQAGQAVGQAVDDIGGYIRSQRESAQVSLRQLARTAGVSNPYLSQIERGLRKPSAEILQQIAKGLRISAEALYVRAGILDERPASAVTDAVLADVHLTERQKQVLLEIYQSFRRENGPTPEPAPPAQAHRPSNEE